MLTVTRDEDGSQLLEVHMSKTEHDSVEWKDIDWLSVEKYCFKLQKRIYRASACGDLKVVRRLQKTLMRSMSARALAVRRVTQDNQGKVTAGVDGIKNLKPEQRIRLAENLRITGKSSPTRRVYIPKPGTNEKRPLGIPTMYDRALQALAKLALEPEWEARFHPESYGFRPGRSCHDAIQSIFTSINKEEKWILDADIAKCFDRIDHQKLLKKVNTFPTLRRQIKSWLKSGVVNQGIFEETDSGTPQGGVISPLLANIALHGMENLEEITDIKGLKMIRYADDFVIIHKYKYAVEVTKQYIAEWLKKEAGLELKESKTSICHTKEGFDFLGFNIKHYEVGLYRSARNNDGTPTGRKTLIKPSKKAIKVHLEKIGRVIDSHKSENQKTLIKRLNPIIKGWCNYYDGQVSKEAFSYCEYITYQKLESWAYRRCPSTGRHAIYDKYWPMMDGRREFATRDGVKLIQHADTKIRRHIKVKGGKSPFDGDKIYWSLRLQNHADIKPSTQKMLKAQKGKCNYCKCVFKNDDVMEKDHIKPKSLGGKNVYSNLQLLHRHCHDKKTAKDGSYRSSRKGSASRGAV